jgi:HPr kinase/phosphorylase
MPQVSALLDFEDLHLHLLCGENGLHREILTTDVNRPGLELTGVFDYFDPERIQIFGRGEIQYLETHWDTPEVQGAVKTIFESPIPCVIVTNSSSVPECLLEWGRKEKVPIFMVDIPTTRLYKRLYDSLEHFFSPTTSVHGTLVDILGMGVLLMGKSGVGKSECALELVSKGHTLVADDVVRVTCFGERTLHGTSPHLLRHYIEVRGLGIVDLSKLYGVRAIRKTKQIDMVITLEEWKPDTVIERVGLNKQIYTILGVDLPHLVIPVKPGRNLSTIVEVGARDQRLKLMGVHSAREFNDRLMKLTAGPKPSGPSSEGEAGWGDPS